MTGSANQLPKLKPVYKAVDLPHISKKLRGGGGGKKKNLGGGGVLASEGNVFLTGHIFIGMALYRVSQVTPYVTGGRSSSVGRALDR